MLYVSRSVIQWWYRGNSLKIKFWNCIAFLKDDNKYNLWKFKRYYQNINIFSKCRGFLLTYWMIVSEYNININWYIKCYCNVETRLIISEARISSVVAFNYYAPLMSQMWNSESCISRLFNCYDIICYTKHSKDDDTRCTFYFFSKQSIIHSCAQKLPFVNQKFKYLGMYINRNLSILL